MADLVHRFLILNVPRRGSLFEILNASPNLDVQLVGGRPGFDLDPDALAWVGWLLLGLPGYAYLAGMESVWLLGGLLVGTWANWRLTAAPLRRATEFYGDSLTLPDYLERRFEDRSGVLRLLRHIFTEADALGIPAAVCGEAAGDRRYTRLLLALGLREFSMYPARLLEIKQAVRQTDIARAQAALTRWLHDPESRSGRTLIEALDESQH